jgi:uncharacterized protein
MLNSLPRRVRIYAALCHLTGVIWLVTPTLLVSGFSSLLSYFEVFPLISVFSYFGLFSLIAVLIPCLTWLANRRVHDFVDRSGREAVNAQLSVLLYTGCAVFMTALACGMNMNLNTAASPLGTGAVMVLIFIVPFGMMVYQIVVIVAAVQALQGNVLRYPLIIRFIPDPLLPL